MKSLYLRSSVALACALSLAACGGSSGNLLLGGTVTGLTKEGLVLQNNGGPTKAVPANSTTFAFDALIEQDSNYDVTVKTQPSAAECKVVNGKAKAGAFNVTSVQVNCVTFSYDIGGTVAGLDSAGLILVNGSDRQSIPANATSFTMTKFNADGSYASGRVPDGSPYGVTVFQQPAGRTCSVANGTGTMGNAPKNDIQITCI